jgi:hypothetical protein
VAYYNHYMRDLYYKVCLIFFNGLAGHIIPVAGNKGGVVTDLGGINILIYAE